MLLHKLSFLNSNYHYIEYISFHSIGRYNEHKHRDT
eukprot:XP_001706331.1 Hypothetical protein GL50803_7053 [Giardia lamblia ATCC 50803]